MLSVDVKCAILVLCELASDKKSDKGLLVRELKIRCSFPRRLNRVTTVLRRHELVSYDAFKGYYRYHAGSDTLTLYDLIMVIDGGLQMGMPNPDDDWPRKKTEYNAVYKTDAMLGRMIERHTKKILIRDFYRNGTSSSR